MLSNKRYILIYSKIFGYKLNLAYICSLPPQQGSICSSSASGRFYFNIVTKECTQFTYNGCSGNLNNFGTLDQCNNFCLSAACTPGDVAYVNPNTNLPFQCN